MVKSKYIKFSVYRFRTNKLMNNELRSDFTDKEKKLYIKMKEFCNICNSKQRLEVDHIVPVVFGGKPIYDNSQVLCYMCHRKKTQIDKMIWFSFKYLKYVVKSVDWDFFVSEDEAKEFYNIHYNRINKMNKNNILDDNMNFTWDVL